MRRTKSPASNLALPCAAFLIASNCVEGATTYIAPDKNDHLGLWAYEIGCAFITSNKIEEILFSPGQTNVESGDEGGEIYTFTASRRLGELEWRMADKIFHPQMEMPLTLEIVNEHSRKPFLDYNAAFMMRWIDFPWNSYVETSLAMGVGLSYSSKVYLMDRKTHDEMDRSHLKIYWPLQITFASPKLPEHQVILFISHQSGGHIFDVGGVNSVGFGYRHGF
jgi:hypothetical protein